ncbi:ribonuclease E inhibitor RraB [Flavisphingomonas formosensis]|uniref:ribonuclease E inhibitor RraB n=1 Tax=Flavisphingomonas formosensis TaxID=861534 RepID=UPI0012F7BE9E|nr:ribonuclease E inhibitor RraB [Sphingomonas formosensis]
MLDPRTWTLLDADTLALQALRASGEDSKANRTITVRFSGRNVSLEHFQRDMVMTGWEITRISADCDGSSITMEWVGKSDDEALRELSERLRTIASCYGVVYEGWAFPAVHEER